MNSEQQPMRLQWMIRPSDILAIVLFLVVIRLAASGVYTSSNYATAKGSMLLAGGWILAFIVAGTLSKVVAFVCRVSEAALSERFPLTSLAAMIGFIGAMAWSVRAGLIALSWIVPASTPPQWLNWLFL